jgi:hypothetical protein
MKALHVAVAMLAASLAAPAVADTVNVYTIGSNPAGLAQDAGGNPIGGIPLISWNHNGVAGPATLSITAEGIDTNEFDEVFFNGVSIGFLTNQGFQVPFFNLNPGPGALPNITALTVSVFNVIALAGINTVSVQLDTENWVNEIEVSELAAVPEPGTIGLLVGGLALLAPLLRRRKV